MKIKNLFFNLLFSSFACCLGFSNGQTELPVGALSTTKTDFWIYEIQGRSPYGKGIHYVMNSSRGGGIGGDKYKYIATLPAGSQIEIIGLIKKSKRKWFYLAKVRNDFSSTVGEAFIVIFHLSMMEEPWRGNVTKRISLDPDLFTSFIYPSQ